MKKFLFLLFAAAALLLPARATSNTVAQQTQVSSVQGSDLFWDWQGGAQEACTAAQMLAYIKSGLGFTLASGKTLTVDNTLTFTGTDGSSVAFGTGGTVLYSSNIGSSVQAYSANLAIYAAAAPNSTALAALDSTPNASGGLLTFAGIGSAVEAHSTLLDSFAGLSSPGTSGYILASSSSGTLSWVPNSASTYTFSSGLQNSSGTVSVLYGTTAGTALQGNSIGSTVEGHASALDAIGAGTWTGSTSITTIGTLSAGAVPWSLLTGVPTTFISNLDSSASSVGFSISSGNLYLANVNATGGLAAAASDGSIGWLGTVDSGSYSIAIGDSSYSVSGGVSLGDVAANSGGVAIGYHANDTEAPGGIAIGVSAIDDGGIAIGFNANDGSDGTGVCVGNSANTSGGVAVGDGANVLFTGVAIGASAYASNGGVELNGGSYAGTGAAVNGYEFADGYGDPTMRITTTSTSVNLGTGGGHCVLVFTGSTSGQTATLPAPTATYGAKIIYIKNRSSVSLTVASASGSQIIAASATSASSSVTLASGNSITLVADGTYWNVLN